MCVYIHPVMGKGNTTSFDAGLIHIQYLLAMKTPEYFKVFYFVSM